VAGHGRKEFTKKQGGEHAPLIIGKIRDDSQVIIKQAANRANTHPATILLDPAYLEGIAMLKPETSLTYGNTQVVFPQLLHVSGQE
jgi:hypothetical protein